MASLHASLAGVPFTASQPKIVRFPVRQPAASRPHRHWWSAAAAVALFGGLAGWLVPTGNPANPVAAAEPAVPVIRSAPSGSPLIPAGFNRGLSEASDEGVIWQSSRQPHRVLRVVYQERVTLKDAEGRTYQMEQPKVEFIIVPAKTD
jgi:hypothetical protein